jgi:acyl phosphate:glycerol-3-phosphate acyltransferase
VSALAIKALLSYLLGSLSGSLLLGRLRNVDIRSLGSGNAGSTNALRTQGKKFALGVLLIDLGKGWLATRVVAGLALPLVDTPVGVGAWIAPACGAAAMLGHVYPLWFGFRGGKAVATLIGVVLAMSPLLVLALVAVWLVVVLLTGFVGLASMVAAALLPLGMLWASPTPRGPTVAFGVFAAALIIFTHRGNIARMREGREPRARRLWLLGRRALR